ncbi:dienelactone hydrolase family protein [Paenibacillus turpanensis]|uniref:dienelactone hydrolase family protein n=1 Tax=Paenibacillus turpanensis TaxID=2689078 RepID=UPI00140AA11F|nr:acetylxylan esterase [Paenibacillus turpanensis]
MYNPDAYIENLLDRLEQKRSEDQRPWLERKHALRGAVTQALGSFGEEGLPPLDPVVLERDEVDGLIRERLEYTTAHGLRVPAYAVYPKEALAKGKLPAVLAWHGHGYGVRESVGYAVDGSSNKDNPGCHNNFVLELAKKGLFVLTPEVVGFGSRKLEEDMSAPEANANSCYMLSVALLMAGKTLAGLRVFEAVRAADYLLSRDEIDPDRLGCIGFSGGGVIASLSSALDSRIKASVICGYTNTYRGSILDRRHCLDNYVPGTLVHAEMPEVIGLIAPRPLFIESGAGDHLFPERHVRHAIEVLRGIYEKEGCAERLQFDIHEGKHEISGRTSFDWLASVLRS